MNDRQVHFDMLDSAGRTDEQRAAIDRAMRPRVVQLHRGAPITIDGPYDCQEHHDWEDAEHQRLMASGSDSLVDGAIVALKWIAIGLLLSFLAGALSSLDWGYLLDSLQWPWLNFIAGTKS